MEILGIKLGPRTASEALAPLAKIVDDLERIAADQADEHDSLRKRITDLEHQAAVASIEHGVASRAADRVRRLLEGDDEPKAPAAIRAVS